MITRTITILTLLTFCLLPLNAQEKKQETGLKREVTLYNPYKPSLPLSRKKSFLPSMDDTLTVRPKFQYNIRTEPYMPAYTISPIKAATLLPDPLPKLYKSFINIGMGNYTTPLAEISITNERSKKGSLGFYARHLSSNGKIELDNGKKVFAGYMDNNASLFGRKFFKKSLFEGSVDFAQKTRYAYGYNPDIVNYSPTKKDTRLNYNDIGAKASLSSMTLDSTSFSYDFDLYYDFFYNAKNLYQHSVGFDGIMAKSVGGFYVGSGISYDYYRLSDSILATPKYIASISPFVKKSTALWNLKLGFQAVIDKNMDSSAEIHLYPDFNFGFSVVPSYIRFFTGLTGKLEKNEPLKVIGENPYMIQNGALFKMPFTDHALIVFAGLKGNTGIGGNYLVSASYSLINDMLFFTNFYFPNISEYGSHFIIAPDNVELLNIHGELSGVINDKVSYYASGNINKYTLGENEYAWNKPGWDSKLGIKYNLRDKILAGVELTGTGKRRLYVSDLDLFNPPATGIYEMPVYVNLNLNAEYRYSKILSFWTKFNNISTKRYYDWAYYPSQRFLFMLGFTYSL